MTSRVLGTVGLGLDDDTRSEALWAPVGQDAAEEVYRDLARVAMVEGGT